MSEIHEALFYLTVRDAGAAITFYARAFGAVESFRLTEPGGRVAHGQMRLGPVTILVEPEHPDLGRRSPEAVGSTSARIHLHVADADAFITRAVDAGATVFMQPTNQFYGERVGVLADPFGHQWVIGHEIERVASDEMQRRFEALLTTPR